MSVKQKLLVGNCLEKLKEIDDCSVQCCVTSPPYWGLRDYGTAKWEGGDENCSHKRESKKSDKTITGHKNFEEMNGVGDAIYKSVCNRCGAKRKDSQIGLEDTLDEYVDNMVNVFREVKRILSDDGVIWINIGDSYSTSTGLVSPQGGKCASSKGDIKYNFTHNKKTTLKPKNIMGVPWRLAFALQEDGWYLRQDIIWHKPNPMPESVQDRCTKSHEYIFLLTKSAKYYYDADAIREPVSEVSLKRAEYGWDCDRPSTKNASMGGKGIHTEKMGSRFVNPEGRNKRSVWTINTATVKDAHFAVFPIELPTYCIKAGSKRGDTILDPFMGSGTTALASQEHGRKWVGVELNPEYVKIIKRRTQQGVLF